MAIHTSGHEFVGTVVQLGSNYKHSGVANTKTEGRPALYDTLKVGDEVVSAFTSNCGECRLCKQGITCRCPSGLLFGSPRLEGGQAQYVRVPFGGATLFPISALKSEGKSEIAAHSLLLLADILPTGVYAAIQALSHPKMATLLTGAPWPYSLPGLAATAAATAGTNDDVLHFAVVGLGPVGMCACVALLDQLVTRYPTRKWKIVAVDPIESRRRTLETMYSTIGVDGKGTGKGELVVRGIEEAKATVAEWTDGEGCCAVLEVVGNSSALKLSYDLVRPFGVITSVGVHPAKPVGFEGDQLYNKNVSLDFGRCPARAMIEVAAVLLAKRQDVFGGAPGGPNSLIEAIEGFKQGPEVVKAIYEKFDKGLVGKVAFDPWA